MRAPDGAGVLAAASDAALGATPFLDWFLVDSGIRCIRALRPTGAVVTGWEALGGVAAVFAVIALAGLALGAVSVLSPRRSRPLALPWAPG